MGWVLLALSCLLLACGGDDGSGSEDGGELEDEQPAATTTTAPGGDSAAGQAGGPAGEGNDAGSSGEQGPSDRALIREAVAAFLRSDDAERVCRRLLSPEFIATGYGSVRGCLDGRPPQTLADGIAFRRTAIRGGDATVIAEPDGGLYDGEQVDLVLRRDDRGRWMITAVTVDVPVGP